MIVYEKVSEENTLPTIKVAIEKAKELGSALLLSSTTGASALLACQTARDSGFGGDIVVVTHAYGVREGGVNTVSDETRATLLGYGAKVVTAAHALSGAERSISGKYQGVYPVELIARSLYMLSQGVKVLVEIGAMALDAGAIEFAKPVVAVAGTGRGLDTAGVLTPAYSAKILDTRIHELLCKPY